MHRLRALVAALLAAATLLPAWAAAATPLDAAPTGADAVPSPFSGELVDAHLPIQPESIGLDYLLQLPQRWQDERFMRLAVLAQFEQQGIAEPGTVETLAKADLFSEEPARIHHDFHPVCDLDGDHATDLITNDLDLDNAESYVFAISGQDGQYIWGRPNLRYFTLSALTNGLYPVRSGMPQQQPPENFAPASDLNGDGVCDALAIGFTWYSFSLGVGAVVVFTFRIHALDGTNGNDIWTREFVGDLALVQTPAVQSQVLQVYNFPTGFVGFDTPAGPRYAFKTTDILFTYVQESLVTGTEIYDYRVTDHVHYADARAPGEDRWVRDLPYDGAARNTNFTWIGGVAQLGGDDEAEIVLDQFWIATPRSNLEFEEPTTGRPMFRHGRGMSMLVLEGADGSTFWRQLILDEGPARVNLQTEEPFQTLVWTQSQIIPDITGDAVPDVVALYLAVEQNEEGTPNGRYRTHVHPLSGADGSFLWGGDHQFRGWGFVWPMTEPGAEEGLLALGTVDLPLPGEIIRGGRFPAKDVQIRALRVSDGTPAWDYRERYIQDNYLPYHFALWQYRGALAARDFNADGVRDPVTPARYIRPEPGQQVLLSTSKHEYLVLDGVSGKPLHSFIVWGPTGMVVPCPGEGNTFTVVSGHARRVDMSRLDPATGEQVWRRPLFNDGRPHAASRGSDFILLTAKCHDTAPEEARTFAMLNMWRRSPHRLFEILPILGRADPGGVFDWLTPELSPDPGIASFHDLLPEPPARPTAADSAAVNASPAILGLAAGLGAGLLRNRARPPRPEDLPQ